jgi:hypothetical protein
MNADSRSSSEMGDRQTFLSALYQKLSFALQASKGNEESASVMEVRRQITEAIKGGRKGILHGEGVTKSDNQEL